MVADLADRMRAKQRRREDIEFEFRIEWGALTDEARDAFMALMDQRRAHGEEQLASLEENVRILQLLFAHKQGAIDALQFVEQVRGAVLDTEA